MIKTATWGKGLQIRRSHPSREGDDRPFRLVRGMERAGTRGQSLLSSRFAQIQDCVCRRPGEDKAFRLSPTNNCKADCSDKGAVNVQSCQILTKTTQGDCKGHISCVCGLGLLLLGEDLEKRLGTKLKATKKFRKKRGRRKKVATATPAE